MSQVHKRNVALSAAEAGVYEAMAALQADKNFSGVVNGDLEDSKASYTCLVDNQLQNARFARVTSTGEYGGVKRTLEAELEPDSSGFPAIAIEGRLYVFDRGYANAIAAPSNPIALPGSVHSEYDVSSEPSYVGRDFDSDGTVPTLHATGDLTTPGYFDSALTRVSLEERADVSKPLYRLDPAAMTSGSFVDITSPPPPGPLAQNTRVDLPPPADPADPPNEMIFPSKVIVPEGVTLHVRGGNAKFMGGLGGEGKVVVDGDILVRTDGVFDPTVEEGLKVHSGGSTFITHPETAIESGDVVDPGMDPIGDYFARMPPEASLDLSVAIPTSAPKGGEFFNWFHNNVGSPDDEFTLWYNGDGTDIYPGLTSETKQWLIESGPIRADIDSWADGT